MPRSAWARPCRSSSRTLLRAWPYPRSPWWPAHERANGGQQPGGHRRLRAEPGRRGTGTRHWVRLAVETAQQAVADAGLTASRVDGFVTASLFPTAGAHAAVDGVSLVSANWLAEHLGVNPRYAAGFQGFGQIPGAVVHGGQCDGERCGRLRAGAPGAPQPAGQLPREPMPEAHGSQQWTVPQGYFGPLAMIALPYNEYLQRYGATSEAMAVVVAEARKNGARIPWSVLVRQAVRTGGLPGGAHDQRPDLPIRLRHSRRRRGCFVFTSAERAKDFPTDRYTSPGTQQARRSAIVFHCIGHSMTSWRSGRRRPSSLGAFWHRSGGGRPSPGLRRVLTVRVSLDGIALAGSGRRGAPDGARRRHRQ